MTLLLTYLFVALFVSFLCSVLEAVLLSSTPSYIESLSKNGDSKTVKKLKDLKSNIDKPISSILTLNTFAHTMGAAGVGAQAQILFGDEWQTAIAFILTLLILYTSEIIPKTLGTLYWRQLSGMVAYFVRGIILRSYQGDKSSVLVSRALLRPALKCYWLMSQPVRLTLRPRAAY